MYDWNATLKSLMAAPEAGQAAYDRNGYLVGLVDDVSPAQETVTIIQAGLVLGLLGREYVVPSRLVADCRADGVHLDLDARSLDDYVRPRGIPAAPALVG